MSAPRSEGESAARSPVLSVVVLSYNRRDLVARGLDALKRQGLGGVEIVVVDNASSDGTVAMIRDRFPEVRLLALPDNVGVRGRNLGIRAARAPVVLSLDDDIELVRPGTLASICECFARDAELAALTLKICDEADGREASAEHWWHPVPCETFQDREFDTDHISEAAVAFRREAFEQVGGYYEALFWGGEEWDLTLGLMDAGYRVAYLPEPVLHLAPRGSLNRQADSRHALLVRNRCWIALRRLPPVAAIRFVVPRLVLWAIRSVRYGYARHYLTGVIGLACATPLILRDRMEISQSTQRRLRGLHEQGRRS